MPFGKLGLHRTVNRSCRCRWYLLRQGLKALLRCIKPRHVPIFDRLPLLRLDLLKGPLEGTLLGFGGKLTEVGHHLLLLGEFALHALQVLPHDREFGVRSFHKLLGVHPLLRVAAEILLGNPAHPPGSFLGATGSALGRLRLARRLLLLAHSFGSSLTMMPAMSLSLHNL